MKAVFSSRVKDINKTMKTINAEQLMSMDIFGEGLPLSVDLAYAKSDNLLFGEAIYRANARLWLHEDLAKIVMSACVICFEKHGLKFVLHDGLRTTDAQKKMLETQRVKENPGWLKEPMLLSPFGVGGHPRGMAIDISLETAAGQALDMGTTFDYLAENPHPKHNPAHRQYANHPRYITENRRRLDSAMIESADNLNTPLMLLSEEWWDFRLPPEIYEQYKPLSDADLPPEMHMVKT